MSEICWEKDKVKEKAQRPLLKQRHLFFLFGRHLQRCLWVANAPVRQDRRDISLTILSHPR